MAIGFKNFQQPAPRHPQTLPKPFFPRNVGRDYELSPTLAPLSEVKNEFTLFSGMSHPDVNGGHSAVNCFLTAARGTDEERLSQSDFARRVSGRGEPRKPLLLP
jgi:uncharacterized protein DUF1552